MLGDTKKYIIGKGNRTLSTSYLINTLFFINFTLVNTWTHLSDSIRGPFCFEHLCYMISRECTEKN